MYVYLVERKRDRKKYIILGDLKNPNIGSGRYLYSFVSDDYEYAIKTPYGLCCNVSLDEKYNSVEFRVVHCTKVAQ